MRLFIVFASIFRSLFYVILYFPRQFVLANSAKCRAVAYRYNLYHTDFIISIRSEEQSLF